MNYNLRDMTNSNIDSRNTSTYRFSVPYDRTWDISNLDVVSVDLVTNDRSASPAPATPGPVSANITADGPDSNSIPSSTTNTNTVANHNQSTLPDSPSVADANTPPSETRNRASHVLIHMGSSAYVVPSHFIPFLIMLARRLDDNLEENRHTMRINPDHANDTITLTPINVVPVNNNDHPPNTFQIVMVPSRTDANLDPSTRDGLGPISTNSALDIATNVTPRQSISVDDALERNMESIESQSPSKEAPLELGDPSTENYKGLEHVPGLYQQVKEDEWECMFRTETGICLDAITGKNMLQSHIATHAREEEKAILEGKLLPEQAVAIPIIEES